MKKSLIAAFIILLLISLTPYAQTAKETWYISPLYQLSDPSGRPLSEIIDAELTKMLIDKRLGSLKKVPFETDTTFSNYIQKDSISRDSEGFLEADAMKKIPGVINITGNRLMIVYDLTGIENYSKWNPEKLEILSLAAAPSAASMVLDHFTSANDINEYDSLWCKISVIDFNNPSLSSHKKVLFDNENCDGPPVECLVETIEKYGKSTTSGKKPDLQLVRSPHDQHIGKIIGGTLLCAGGIGLFTISRAMNDEVNGPTIFFGVSMIAGGATLLSIGLIKQNRYLKWKQDRR